MCTRDFGTFVLLPLLFSPGTGTDRRRRKAACSTFSVFNAAKQHIPSGPVNLDVPNFCTRQHNFKKAPSTDEFELSAEGRRKRDAQCNKAEYERSSERSWMFSKE